ncbi:MAG: aminopeptidase N [Mariprofundales bacterium]
MTAMHPLKTTYLKEYRPPQYLVESVSLTFLLNPEATEVTATVAYRRDPAATPDAVLTLDGHDMELLAVRLDGRALDQHAYVLNDAEMRLSNLPVAFQLEITTRIDPQSNTALEGLYRSSGNYCTQCEAEGFRRITYYQDHPDVMAVFHVRIVAEKRSNPILLSNGNPVGSGDLADGMHWAEWHDPHPKPCYLFALVAGDLSCVEEHFTTASGRVVTLRIFTEAHHIKQCGHAMESLKRAMRWDETRFGREYDLDLFMIVAVDDFNMGAMENKGLNIFNSRLLFASAATATDDDYIAIEAVIAHEYFHNWTGNRITCRDWFQLSLKEGLTVFRDQAFTADMHSGAVKRIEVVRMLRSHQFAEDAGPMAHPVRPASYMEINNFYTVTVYEKGAEVVRLYQTLLGVDGFRRGMDLYFDRHDGQAVTTEDFLAAMADANGVDLSQMQRWYDQAGTPKLRVRMHYDSERQRCTLTCSQSSPDTPESSDKQPFPIPLSMALLQPNGTAQPLQLEDESEARGEERMLLVNQSSHTFTFIHVDGRPVPSLLRGFSAPVELDYNYSAEDNVFLMQHDSDDFNRWSAGQRLAMDTLLSMLDGADPDAETIKAFDAVLCDDRLDPALRAEVLMLPSEQDIAASCVPADPAAIHRVRERLRSLLATTMHGSLNRYYHQLSALSGMDDVAMQQRKLKSVCLDYLLAVPDDAAIALAWNQFASASNMTDQYAALAVLSRCDCPERNQLLAAFAQQWSDESGVMDRWFAVQAASPLPDTLARVKSLLAHAQFDLRNPNKVRALIGTFAMRNPASFHAVDGSGYRFVADQVLALDKINPQIAARIASSLIHWKRVEPVRAARNRAQLQRIADHADLSVGVYEIVSKGLSC